LKIFSHNIIIFQHIWPNNWQLCQLCHLEGEEEEEEEVVICLLLHL
jgi:hypothetical protein